MEILAVHILNGLTFGFILFLLSSGLSLVMGTMGVLNLAHGGFYMLGAYIGLMVVGYGVNFWLAAVVAGIIMGLVGLGIERFVLRRIHNMMSEQALSTFGFLYILTNVALWIWGPWAKMGTPPGFFSGSIGIGRLAYPVYRLVVILLGLMIAVGLYWLQEKTRYGSIIRAGMDDKETTTGLGINYEAISSAVFALGSFLAAFAGSIGTPLVGAYLLSGVEVLLLALIVVVVGGMGTIQGTLVGALIIGLIDSFGRAIFPDLAMFTVYLAMVIMIVMRPSGLVGRKVT